jgi:hypothetical protein
MKLQLVYFTNLFSESFPIVHSSSLRCSSTHRFTLRGIHQLADPVSCSVHIIWSGKNKAIDTFHYQILRTHVGADDHRQAGGHRFKHNHAEGVEFREHDENIRCPVVALQPIDLRSGECQGVQNA